MASLKKLFNEYGIAVIVFLLVLAYVVHVFANSLSSKISSGTETYASKPNAAYSNVQSSGAPLEVGLSSGQADVFASANGMQTSMPGSPMSSGSSPQLDPSELLPKNVGNSSWAQLNPSGQGSLANVNMLKAGYHIGIDTIGQTLRNPNLQIRSEPPNPQIYTGPWNISTITPDFMRPSLEIGSGTQ